MKSRSRESLDAYYVDAASWNRDRLQASRSAQRAAWWVAGAAVAIAALEAAALLALMPLKTVVPYTLMVDRTTGYVQAIKPLNPSTVAPGTALTQSFLVQYVIGREGFDRDTVKTNYRKVALLSAGRARSSYLQQMQVSNPRSPLVLYPRGTSVDVRVKSVSPIGPNVALVRFDTVRTDAGGRAGAPGQWIAVVHYRYSGEPMSLEDRFVNPLGFEVTSYRRDSEAVSPAPEVEAAVQPAEAVVESASRPSPLIDSSPTAPEARQ